MRFLLDAKMLRAALQVLIAAGHSASHVRDLGVGASTDAVLDRYAQTSGDILVTRELDFADTRVCPPAMSPGRVVLRVTDNSTACDIAVLLGRFRNASDLIARIPCHLLVLEQDRVRFRPALVEHDA